MNIQAFAERCGLTAHTLRYYERIGLLGDIARLPNGHRVFGPRDVEWVGFLHRLRSTGMGIAEMQRYATLRAAGASTLVARRRMLEAHAAGIEADLLQRRAHLLCVREKLGVYDSLIDAAGRAGAVDTPVGSPRTGPPARNA